MNEHVSMDIAIYEHQFMTFIYPISLHVVEPGIKKHYNRNS